MAIKPSGLIILDGFGLGKPSPANAIALAEKPMLDYLFKTYPHTTLAASGCAVGLPCGYDGNSEVGHTTIGAGRIVPATYTRIKESIDSGVFFNNKVFLNYVQKLSNTDQALHIIGILSDAGNQGHSMVIKACTQLAVQLGIKSIYIHPILDGRDVSPQSAGDYLHDLQESIQGTSAIIASVTGRFYAMDRDQNWDRTLATYHLLTKHQKAKFSDWKQALVYYYERNCTDEFIPPTLLHEAGIIKAGDGVIFTNFREDRARQLTACFVAPEQTPLGISMPLAFFISAIKYADSFNNPVLFKTNLINDTLKQVLSDTGKSIFSIAETEKYAHVTYFLGGEQEKPFENEKQLLIPSLSHAQTYAEYPCMSAGEITQSICLSLQENPADFYCINYANADMVGHSGDLQATIKAIEYLDDQIKILYDEFIIKRNGMIFITADHGNAECKKDLKTGQPLMKHTKNPVPFIYINSAIKNKKIYLPLKGLADVAPFILKELDIVIPAVMTGSQAGQAANFCKCHAL